jgi:dolichol-phosphate mannosyltransferase
MNRTIDDPITVPFSDGASRKISVVCPCYHEEEGIGAFYTKLKQVLVHDCPDHQHEIVFVDDGSRDATLECLQKIAEQDNRVRVFSLTRNLGHQIALSAGLDVAEGDATIVMDSDLQHPPELIPELIQQWQEGHDVVLAVRQQTEGASLFKRLSSDGFYSVFNFLSDVKLTPGAADFCLLSRKAHDALCRMPERRRFLRGMVAWMGFKTARVLYTAPSRFAGESKYSLRRMLALALDATFSFSTRPIRLASKAGAFCVVVGMIYLAYVLGRYFVVGDLLPGWASIVGTILLMGGVQLLSIGLIGEYLAHVFEEVKGRPQYLFKYSSDETQQAIEIQPSFRTQRAANETDVLEFGTQGDEKCA